MEECKRCREMKDSKEFLNNRRLKVKDCKECQIMVKEWKQKKADEKEKKKLDLEEGVYSDIKIKPIYSNFVEEGFDQEKSINNYKLETFDIKKMMDATQKNNFSSILTASRRSGKTYLLEKLYKDWAKLFDIIITFSYSAVNPTYKFVTDLKFSDYKNEIMNEINEFQFGTGLKYKILIIFDDLASKSVKHKDGILQAFIRGRNANLSIVLSTQDYKLVDKTCRSNTDFLFIGKTNNAENRLSLIESTLLHGIKYPDEIIGKGAKLAYADKWIMKKTEDKKFVVIDMFGDKEEMFTYRA